MYIYNFGVGQQQPIFSVVNGVQQLGPGASQLLQTLFTNRYPQLTGSWKAATGVTAPAFDPTADLWSYIAASTPAQAGGVSQSVYDQFQSMPDKSLFLVDVPSAQAAISGAPANVVYAIAKDRTIVSTVAGPGSSFARLLAPATAPAPTRRTTNVAPAVAAISIGALIALILASAA